MAPFSNPANWLGVKVRYALDPDLTGIVVTVSQSIGSSPQLEVEYLTHGNEPAKRWFHSNLMERITPEPDREFQRQIPRQEAGA